MPATTPTPRASGRSARTRILATTPTARARRAPRAGSSWSRTTATRTRTRTITMGVSAVAGTSANDGDRGPGPFIGDLATRTPTTARTSGRIRRKESRVLGPGAGCERGGHDGRPSRVTYLAEHWARTVARTRLNKRKPRILRVFRSTATGIRTPVSAVRGRRPSPLDDGGPAADCTNGRRVDSAGPTLDINGLIGRLVSSSREQLTRQAGMGRRRMTSRRVGVPHGHADPSCSCCSRCPARPSPFTRGRPGPGSTSASRRRR